MKVYLPGTQGLKLNIMYAYLGITALFNIHVPRYIYVYCNVVPGT
jgi:hypothetical protein